jgi:uncharacterized protein (TIGR02231 family)
MRRWFVLAALLLALGAAGTALFVRAEGRHEAPAPEPKKEAPEPPRTAPSRINQVTVYQNTALVTRDVEVPPGTGTMELVVTPLPPTAMNNSLYSEGSDGILVLATRFRTRAIQEDTREEVRKLQAQLKERTQAEEKIKAEMETIKQNVQMLGKLENFTAATTEKATEKATLNGETVITLTKYVMDTRAEKSKELVDLQQQLQTNQEQIEFIKRQLQEAASGSAKTERDAVIVVDKKNQPAGKIRLNYLVESAAWRPQYKFRAGKDEKEAVQVEYLAAVMQQTGEDWKDVGLILSTAEPMLNAAPPELKVFEVAVTPRAANPNNPMDMPNQAQFAGNFDQAQQLRGRARQEYNSKNPTAGGTLINQASALEQTNEILSVGQKDAQQPGPARRVAHEGQSVTYHLDTHLTVPSRNDEQVLEVARLTMEPDYLYKAVPVLTSHVYRLANLNNKSKYVLLPGEATMYLGSDFVGRMDLPLVAIGEQFTVGFGVDPQLQVQRQLLDKARSMQGGNQVLKYDYHILVSSYKAEPVTVQVWDRLPHAENETVGVTLGKSEPELCADPVYLREERPHNLLRWDLKVDPSMNGEKARVVHYDFKLELDRQMTLGGFQTADLPAPAAAPRAPKP